MPLSAEEQALQPGLNDASTFIVTVMAVVLLYVAIRYFQRKA